MVIRTLNSSPGALPFSINVSNATPETQFIRHDINQDKSNGQDHSPWTH